MTQESDNDSGCEETVLEEHVECQPEETQSHEIT